MRVLLTSVFGILVAVSSAQAADQIEHADPAAVSGPVVTVHIKQMKFDPKELVVAKGTTVVWKNDDAMPHNVEFGKGSSSEIKGDMLRAGQTFALKFNEAGDFSYTCTPHPFMKATIKVE